MRNAIGLILIIIGATLGLYVGVWLCFVGGIKDILNVLRMAINNNIIEGLKLGIGIIKIVFAGFIGQLSASICIIPGYIICKKNI